MINTMNVVLILTLTLMTILSQNLIRRHNGWYITGRGCGLNTELTFLKSILNNIKEFHCSFIPDSDIKKVEGDCALNSTAGNVNKSARATADTVNKSARATADTVNKSAFTSDCALN
jgi:hypothetical protein